MHILNKILKGYKPLAVMGSQIILYRKGAFYVSDETLSAPKFFCAFSFNDFPFRLLNRLRRREITAAKVVDKTSLIFTQGSLIWNLNLKAKTVTKEFDVPGGKKLLRFSEDFSDHPSQDIYVGEYFSNRSKDPVNIYKRDISGGWNVVYTFAEGEIDHVHAISLFGDNVTVLTGDFEQGAGIWSFDRSFTQTRNTLSGNQQYRSCVGVPTSASEMIYATDTHLAPNALYALDHTQSDKLTKLSDLPGSVIYGTKSKDQLIFGTSIEPGLETGNFVYDMLTLKKSDVCNDYFCHLFAYDFNTGQLTSFFSARKDSWPLRLFQFGSFFIPQDNLHNGSILAYGMGLKGLDHCTLLFKQEP